MAYAERGSRLNDDHVIQEHPFSISFERMREHHERLLSDIVKTSQGSKIYYGRFGVPSGLNKLSEIPLTSYFAIDHAIEKYGLEACLLRTPDLTFSTSGSTGKPKRMFYGRGDIERVGREFSDFCRFIGLEKGDIGWNLGGAFPNVSGAVLESACYAAGIETLPTLLYKDSDLVHALRKACKVERIDAMASAALVFYFVGKGIHDPDFLRETTQRKLRESYHLPRPLARSFARIYLHGVDMERLGRTLEGCRTAFTYAEPLTPYLHDLRESFPHMNFHDVFGSTENPITAAQLEPGTQGLSIFLTSAIPELADPKLIAEAKESSDIGVPGVLWTDWTKGMKGELIMTRPGECLPLVRYPTGDLIEVLDPARTFRTEVGGSMMEVTLPLIKVLGREAEALDFEVRDEGGCFLGNKIYSRNIHEALQRPHNIRWWELYNIKGQPGRLCFLIVR